jgi:heat shock protein HtpX
MANKKAFGRDTGLQTRMVLTLFLLGLVYALLIGVLIAAGAGAVTIAVIAALLFSVQLFTSDKIALFSMGAKEVTPAQAPELHAMIERLCIQANLPKPRVAVAQTAMPNAFAVGRTPKTATVCATTGILNLLNEGELEAVLAHELTHVQNRDVMVMTIASFFASIAAFITQFGFIFGFAGGMGGRGGGRGGNNQGGDSFAIVLLVSVAVYAISFLLLQALSRYREFAADRGSAIITGRPSALISALRKLSDGMGRIPQQDLRAASGELAAFYIMPPKAKQTVSNLFSTHPPLEKRIAALERLEAQLQGTA